MTSPLWWTWWTALTLTRSSCANTWTVFSCMGECVQCLKQQLHSSRLHYCRVREYERGYWPMVRYFTRSEAVETLSHLPRVLTDVGRGGWGRGRGEGGGGVSHTAAASFPTLRPSVAVPGTQRAVYGELCAHVSREPGRRFRALPEVGVNAPSLHMKLILPLIPPL